MNQLEERLIAIQKKWQLDDNIPAEIDALLSTLFLASNKIAELEASIHHMKAEIADHRQAIIDIRAS